MESGDVELEAEAGARHKAPEAVKTAGEMTPHVSARTPQGTRSRTQCATTSLLRS